MRVRNTLYVLPMFYRLLITHVYKLLDDRIRKDIKVLQAKVEALTVPLLSKQAKVQANDSYAKAEASLYCYLVLLFIW